jgi:phosphoglycerol transferase MdoB-like AlkP superfamily enzyme
VLREAGYQTTCIHPHPARFFRRDRAFPNLGFDRFIDLRSFRSAGKFGPYISDEAVTDRLLHELKSDGKPSFHFVITMENHGPLHLEQVSAADTATYYTAPPPSGCEDLTVYLRHLRNADQQLGRLRAFLHSRTRPTLFCFYGEHLPSMPKVYDALGQPDGRTDYLILSPRASGFAILDLNVEKIAGAILEELALI